MSDKSDRLLNTLIVAGFIAIVTITTVCTIAVIHRMKADADYAATGFVASVDGDDAVYETADGNLWRASSEGFSAGDDVVLLFDDKGTPSVYDDEITRVIPLK